ncbi:hypothetical protein [Amaricoccus solimangrovi]|uniref:DUF4410 domain-containing protein n=1 Tax=Amaricoccus solimangrovi TaxID=2589815 RepID=A0A501WK14_9RHOB|nr:hypothetical protein [Amaricoccus solimangrovi]TPE50203.1 hypothetical protein FJM51_12525 [Amaricoccus solimangrovi]
MKAFALLTASALALAACSGEPEMPTRLPISEITVNTDLSAIGNRSAVNYWSNLSTDLKTALANEFVNDIAPGGAQLTVDVDELALAQSYSQGLTQNSTLKGQVIVNHRGTVAGTYNVTATMAEAMASEEQGGKTPPAPDSTESYQALLKAFARGVDQQINPVPAP